MQEKSWNKLGKHFFISNLLQFLKNWIESSEYVKFFIIKSFITLLFWIIQETFGVRYRWYLVYPSSQFSREFCGNLNYLAHCQYLFDCESDNQIMSRLLRYYLICISLMAQSKQTISYFSLRFLRWCRSQWQYMLPCTGLFCMEWSQGIGKWRYADT